MINKKLFALLCLHFWGVTISCFTLSAQTYAKYWVQFIDKQGTTFSIDKPYEFLSPRAIDKRNRFNIPITEQDLPVSRTYIDKILALDKSTMLLTQSKWLNGITIYCEHDSMFVWLKKLPFVQHCEITHQMEQAEEKITEPYLYQNLQQPTYEKSLQLKKEGTTSINYGKAEAQIRVNNAHWLHLLGYYGEGMAIMIMDGGFQNADKILHFKLQREENRVRAVRNFAQPMASPYHTGEHGTNVLSCITSWIPGEHIGTAPFAEIYLAQTEDGRSENPIEEDNWVAGLEWADSLGCDVLNSSLGYTKFDNKTNLRTYKDLDGKKSRASQAAAIAASKGIIVCNSAGNEGAKKWHYIGSPADAFNILSVGAVNIYKQRAPFSSYGPTADGRVKPEAVAVGWNTYVATRYGKTRTSNGTSFSAPLLSGMTTCLWQAFPSKNAFEIMNAIKNSGHQAHLPDTSLGYGITDFMKAFNLLLQKESRFKIEFLQYVIYNKKAQLSIISPIDTMITIEIINESIGNTTKEAQPQKTIHKSFSIKKGENLISITLPKIPKNEKFRINKTRITCSNEEFIFLLGQEKAPFITLSPIF